MTHSAASPVVHDDDTFCQTHALFETVLAQISDNPLLDAFVAMAQAEYDSYGLHQPARHAPPTPPADPAQASSHPVLQLSSRVRDELEAAGDDLDTVLRLRRTRAFLLEAVEQL